MNRYLLSVSSDDRDLLEKICLDLEKKSSVVNTIRLNETCIFIETPEKIKAIDNLLQTTELDCYVLAEIARGAREEGSHSKMFLYPIRDDISDTING